MGAEYKTYSWEINNKNKLQICKKNKHYDIWVNA